MSKKNWTDVDAQGLSVHTFDSDEQDHYETSEQVFRTVGSDLKSETVGSAILVIDFWESFGYIISLIDLDLRAIHITAEGVRTQAWTDLSLVLRALGFKLNKPPAKLFIYEPFYCQGSSKKYLNKLGFLNVSHENVDFYATVGALAFSLSYPKP